ncbi:cytochrome P450 [Streptomyces sp. NPDC092296]|uniref:cytochrome P450 n=1 Tax=Streptomyces sp. NPDC092296 TaxID=3366012 RepID=UPI003803617B
MAQDTLLRQILDHENRADPYPLYAELRRTPVARQQDGSYAVSTYWEIRNLLQDPRLSVDPRNAPPEAAAIPGDEDETEVAPSFLRLDPPEHDRLRTITMQPFGPPHSPRRIDDMRGELTRIVAGLIDGFTGRDRVDLVDDFAYPFPVTVICRLLGVPREDEPRFHVWAETLVSNLDPNLSAEAAAQQRRATRQARGEMAQYLTELIDRRRRSPGDDMLSALAAGHGPEGRLSQVQLVTTATLLLIAGHETTVNLITNGMLTLLRRPEILDRLRREPALAAPLVEELLRYEPPVQFLPQRSTLADVDVAGTLIPKGSAVRLMLAAGNRDPLRFADPDRFDPDRPDNQHLGFGSGIHSCFGAPLARLETQLALTALAHRLERPRLLEDPPPYRRNAVLRGPRHLGVAFDGLRPAPTG